LEQRADIYNEAGIGKRHGDDFGAAAISFVAPVGNMALVGRVD
jgi:hypothetical protein